MMMQQTTGKRDMKRYHVICVPEITLMTTMMLVQLIWDIINLKEKKELFL